MCTVLFSRTDSNHDCSILSCLLSFWNTWLQFWHKLWLLPFLAPVVLDLFYSSSTWHVKSLNSLFYKLFSPLTKHVHGRETCIHTFASTKCVHTSVHTGGHHMVPSKPVGQHSITLYSIYTGKGNDTLWATGLQRAGAIPTQCPIVWLLTSCTWKTKAKALLKFCGQTREKSLGARPYTLLCSQHTAMKLPFSLRVPSEKRRVSSSQSCAGLLASRFRAEVEPTWN